MSRRCLSTGYSRMYPYPPKIWTDLWQARDAAPGGEPLPGDPPRLRRAPAPAPVQGGHGVCEPLPSLSEPVPHRDPAVVEGERDGVGPFQTHLVLRLPGGISRHPRLDEEGADPFLRLLFRNGHDDGHAGVGAGGA